MAWNSAHVDFHPNVGPFGVTDTTTQTMWSGTALTAGTNAFVIFHILDLGGDPFSTTASIYDNIGGSGTPWSIVKSVVGGSTSMHRTVIAYRENIPSGITTITISPENHNQNFYSEGTVVTFSGGATSASLSTSANYNNDTFAGAWPLTSSVSLTVSDADCLVFFIIGGDSSGSSLPYTLPSGYTDEGKEVNSTALMYEAGSQLMVGTGTFNPTFSKGDSYDYISALHAAFKNDGSVAPSLFPPSVVALQSAMRASTF